MSSSVFKAFLLPALALALADGRGGGGAGPPTVPGALVRTAAGHSVQSRPPRSVLAVTIAMPLVWAFSRGLFRKMTIPETQTTSNSQLPACNRDLCRQRMLSANSAKKEAARPYFRYDPVVAILSVNQADPLGNSSDSVSSDYTVEQELNPATARLTHKKPPAGTQTHFAIQAPL